MAHVGNAGTRLRLAVAVEPPIVYAPLTPMLDDAPGGPLAKYEMLRPLGSGGMGEVYLARDRALNRQVAIKVVSPDRLGDEASQRRLVLEAQAAAALDHPCICPVYEAGTSTDGRTFIVMQYVEGETLAERLRRGPLDQRSALLLASDMADALTTAHQHGVVHRDLKPQNIILTPTGRPKLLDFGLAKQQTGLALLSTGEQKTRTTLTVQGAIVGTPGYMSPEQVRALPLDGRSDLFSLGAVLFECLTGTRAFSGPTAVDVFGHTLQTDPPPVTALRADLAPSLDSLCARLLAKNPSERFQSAPEVLGAVRAILDGTRPKPQPVPPAWRPGRRELLGAGGLALALGAIGGVWIWTHRLAPPPPKAVEWFERGTAQIRDGAYYSAKRALGEAIRIFPAYPQAQARLAEALSELDEERDAQATLLRASSVLDTGSARLSEDDRLRFEAVRALVVRELDTAVANYKQIVAREPNDAGAWLDLGRAQEEAGLRDEARKSYEKALSIDGGYAAAHLRLGKLAADEERRADALKSFDAAEHYYALASNIEGQTEVLLRRGAFLNSVGEIVQARTVLNRAATLAATASENTSLRVRTMLEQASVTASEGRLADAEKIASDAVRMATDAGLDTIAAEGLIESASTQLRVDTAKAEATLKQAIALASRQGARHVAARASLQLAAMYVDQDRPQDGLVLIDRTLPFLRERQYNRLELTALVTAARAYEGLGRFGEQLTAAARALAIAEANHDEANAANALDSLASHAEYDWRSPDGAGLSRAERSHPWTTGRPAVAGL